MPPFVPSVTISNVSRYCQMSQWEKLPPNDTHSSKETGDGALEVGVAQELKLYISPAAKESKDPGACLGLP